MLRVTLSALAAFSLSLAAGFAQEPGKEKRVPILPKGKDLAANPGFELGEAGRPSGWILAQPPGGMKAEWGAFGIEGSQGMQFTGPKDVSAKARPAGITQILRDLEPGRTVVVTVWLRLTSFRGLCLVWARCDGKDGPERREGAFQNSTGAGYDLQGSTIWSPVTVMVTPGEKTAGLIIGILVRGIGTVAVDEVHAFAREAPAESRPARGRPPKAGPGLYRAEGWYVLKDAKGADRMKVWIPVPILWRDQIPLTFRAWTDPEGHIQSISLIRRSNGFHFAEIVLGELTKAGELRFRWESHVLALPHMETPIPKGIALPLNEVPAEVKGWLAPSWCCDAAHPEVLKIAEAIRKSGSTADVLVPATLKRMQSIFRGAKGRVTALTAVQALTKRGSCTSCANLGAALLRALGIPARVIAGYPTWSGPLQTHYVVEYWLPKGGWRLMESTRCLDDRPGYEQIEVAMVLPEDESEAKAKGRVAAAGAVPYLSLTEYPEAKGRESPWLVGNIPNRPGSDHQAVQIAIFEAAPEVWETAVKQLKARWRALTGEAVKTAAAFQKLAPVTGLDSVKTLPALLKALGNG
ncbi:MAG: transglutaminase-like domain-containing protein [Planctomycetota bacterium]|jgi:hypothetical protein